ncbi:MAG: leucyl aminopeptidase family protein [bacterium]
MRTELEFCQVSSALDGVEGLMIVGRAEALADAAVRALVPPEVAWDALLDDARPGDAGVSRSTWLAGTLRQVAVGIVPTVASRHNCAARPDAVASLVRAGLPSGSPVAVILVPERAADALAVAAAVARALPLYARKTGKSEPRRRLVRVAVLPADGGIVDVDRLAEVADALRFAARLVDMPASELDTEAFVDVARDTAARVGAEITVIEGEALGHGGFGGLWNVGRAAVRKPALVVLEHAGRGGRSISLVGKGIVYDTGGLCLKPRVGMTGMKGDMGGAAAVLGAFAAAVRLGTRHRLRAVLCLAENAIGPDAMRPDDIITLYSGKTVEVNNTDAEGRLVLGDGVAYAVRHLQPEIIIDLATLTGAQLIATGKRHAASVCNDEELESAAVDAGRRTGDLVHPLPYCPEFFRREFKSPVADLKNSVKDRSNAQSSCAGQFIAEHLGDFAGSWLHLDIAGPAHDAERGTGYGVALLVDLLETL